MPVFSADVHAVFIYALSISSSWLSSHEYGLFDNGTSQEHIH